MSSTSSSSSSRDRRGATCRRWAESGRCPHAQCSYFHKQPVYYFYDAHNKPKPYSWVDTREQLLVAFKDWNQASVLAFDTEFKSDSFFPKLSLIQVSDGSKTWLVDVLRLRNQGHSIEPIFEILMKPTCLKVFHACEADIRGFFKRFGDRVASLGPIFDTQIAASLAPHSTQIVESQGLDGKATAQLSYAKLVQYLLPEVHERRPVSKDQQRSDWLHRPLQEEQLGYAAEDVLHLIPLYNYLSQAFSKEDHDQKIQEYISNIKTPSQKKFLQAFCIEGEAPSNPDEPSSSCDTSVKKDTSSEDGLIDYAWKLYFYRESKCRQKDLPRSKVISDDTILRIVYSRDTPPDDVHQYVAALPPLSDVPSHYQLKRCREPRIKMESSTESVDLQSC